MPSHPVCAPIGSAISIVARSLQRSGVTSASSGRARRILSVSIQARVTRAVLRVSPASCRPRARSWDDPPFCGLAMQWAAVIQMTRPDELGGAGGGGPAAVGIQPVKLHNCPDRKPGDVEQVASAVDGGKARAAIGGNRGRASEAEAARRQTRDRPRFRPAAYGGARSAAAHHRQNQSLRGASSLDRWRAAPPPNSEQASDPPRTFSCATYVAPMAFADMNRRRAFPAAWILPNEASCSPASA